MIHKQRSLYLRQSLYSILQAQLLGTLKLAEGIIDRFICTLLFPPRKQVQHICLAARAMDFSEQYTWLFLTFGNVAPVYKRPVKPDCTGRQQC
jgi:hypothetical protein